MSNCPKCGKWAGAHATLPGQSMDHLCHCTHYDTDEITTLRTKLAEAERERDEALAKIEAEGWLRITAPGQVKEGDLLRFTIGNEQYIEKAKLLLNPGTDREEIIYRKKRNYYLITSNAIAGTGSQKNCMYMPRAMPSTSHDKEVG